jgi:WD40 repeat protein
VVQRGHASDVVAVALSPDGELLATGSRDDTARLWSVGSGEELRVLAGHTDDVTAVAFAPGASVLATGGRDDTVRLWDTDSGDELAVLRGHAFPITALAFSADGSTLASGSEDHHVIAWDVAAAQELRRVGGRPAYAEVTAVDLSADGRHALAGFSDGTARVFDLKRGRETTCLGDPGPVAVTSVTLGGDGSEALTGHADGRVGLWRLDRGVSVWSVQSGSGAVLGTRLASAGGAGVAITADGTVHVHDRGSGRESTRVQAAAPATAAALGEDTAVLAAGPRAERWSIRAGAREMGYGARTRGVRSLVVLDDGGLSIVAADRGLVQLVHRGGEARVRALGSPSVAVRVVAQSSCGRWLAAATADEQLALWDLDGAEGPRVLRGHRAGIDALAFSPQGDQLASGSADGRIVLWQTSTGEAVTRLDGHERAVAALSFTADGEQLLSGGWDATARLWDLDDGEELLKLATPGHFVQSVAARGERLATGNGDNTISLWQVDGGEELLRLAAHGNAVRAMAFSASGRYLLSGGGGGEATLWEARSGDVVADLAGHTGPLTAVAFGPGDRWLATGGADATTRIWSTDGGEPLCTAVCADDGSWSIVDRLGRYAGTTPGHHRGVHWVQQRDPIQLAQAGTDYHQPDLLAQVLSGEAFPAMGAFYEVAPHPTIEVAPPAMDDRSLSVTLVDRGGGIGALRIYVNDRAHPFEHAPTPAAAGTRERLDLHLADVLLPGRSNQVRLVACNAAGDQCSRDVELSWSVAGTSVSFEPHLWAVVAAASRYGGPDGDLRYGAADARELADALQRVAAAIHGPERVHLELITGDRPATREALRDALQGASGAAPEDTLVVVLSGYGGQDGDGPLRWMAERADGGAGGEPVTSDELIEWTADVAANKRVLVLDLCGAAEPVRDLAEATPPGDGAARDVLRIQQAGGFHVLAGRSSDRTSHEASARGRGWLTSALLGELAGPEQPLAVVSMLRAVEHRVGPAVAGVPGVRAPLLATAEARNFQIGRSLPDLAVAPARPLVLRPDVRWHGQAYDALELEAAIRARLLHTLGDGRGPMVYVDAVRFEAGLRSEVVYRLDGEFVHATLRVWRGTAEVASQEVAGTRDDLAGLAVEIAERLLAEGAISAAP